MIPEIEEQFPWEQQGEVFQVETPEMTLLEFPVADLGSRIVAVLLDYLLLGAIAGVLGLLLFILNLLGGLSSQWTVTLVGFVILAWFFGSTLYFVWFEVRREGRTPGKRRMGIQVVHLSGRGLSFGPSLLRNLARYVDEIPIMLIIPALVPGRRRIGDLLAQTIVIRDPPTEPRRRRILTQASLERLGGSLRFLDSRYLARLDPEDLNLLEYLEERLPQISRKQRVETLRPIAERYILRLGLEEQRDEILQDPQRFLQEMAYLMKGHFQQKI